MARFLSFLTPTQTLLAVQKFRLYPTELGSVVPRWHHELVVPLSRTTATAPGSQSVDSRCEATVTQVVTGLFLA